MKWLGVEGGLSAIADARGKRRERQLCGSQLSPTLLQVRTAAFPAAGRQDPTLSCPTKNVKATLAVQGQRAEERMHSSAPKHRGVRF